jgi:hypothetical protein
MACASSAHLRAGRILSFGLMNLTEAGVITTRTLTIVLPEADWQALRTAEPDAIGWLQAQIRRRLGDEPPSKRQDETENRHSQSARQ